MFTRVAGWLFGCLLVALSLFVAVETALRKLIGVSLQGADELGGYVLALGGALAFTVALLERAHVRIDVLYSRMPFSLRTAIDLVCALAFALLGLFPGAIRLAGGCGHTRLRQQCTDGLGNAHDFAAVGLVRLVADIYLRQCLAGGAGVLAAASWPSRRVGTITETPCARRRTTRGAGRRRAPVSHIERVRTLPHSYSSTLVLLP